MSKQTTHDKISLLGIDVDAISNADAIHYICERAAPGQPAVYITKPYVEFLDRAYHRPDLRQLINGAELTLPDGVALLWAATYLYAGPRNLWRFCKTLGQIILAPNALRWPLPDRTAGVNFTWPLLEQAASRGLRVYLIGTPSAADITGTARAIRHRLPKLEIVGTSAGRDPDHPAGEVSEAWLETTRKAVEAVQPDLILVGMGFPLQEHVCAYLAAHTRHGVYVGEGGTFDYESFGGHRPKAPAALQRIGLEWLWRLILEPKRLGRQLAIPRFIWRIWRNR